MRYLFWGFLCFFATVLPAQSPAVFKVGADKPGGAVQPTMWGIFFEDINMGADGGLYAELVKNRSFEFAAPLMGWREFSEEGATGSLLVHNRAEKQAHNPRFLRVTRKSAEGQYGLTNEGFRGMGIQRAAQYDFSVWARQAGSEPVNLTIMLQKPSGEQIATASLSISGKDWQKRKVSLQSTAAEPKARLLILLDAPGAVDLDMISLFPQQTWKGRPGGLRADLVQLLADLKPGFLRFPGGCIVEGRELATRYQWKKTIGNIEDREVLVNRWNTEFAHRPTPDYYQSFGLGFYEYFQLAEDIGAAPLPILNCGMACQFNSAEVAPAEQLDPYIQDALDLIEFANGSPATTRWGKLRADLGHPAPFNLKFMGVGNEQWGEQYVERYKLFSQAIKSKYPDVRLVSSAGPFSDGELFDYLSKEMATLKADIVDEHYYRSPEWFLQNAGRYDHYDRSGPRIFAGEYAAQSVTTGSPDNRNNWRCALSEAAFMTGLERNADLVHMASYAPLFAHVEGWQWTPDLIWFDNLRAYGTPNYYVQQLFSTNRGSRILPITYQGLAATGQDGLYASSTLDEASGTVIVKIVNTTAVAKPAEILIDGLKKINGTGTCIAMGAYAPAAVNALDAPKAVSPATREITVKDRKVTLELPAGSFSVIRIGGQ